MSTGWGFTAFSVSLGSSYFQRLLSANPHLESAVRANVKYQEYVDHMSDKVGFKGFMDFCFC